MNNRSNINLVGNTTQGQNVGVGTNVYKGKAGGNILQYKTLSVTGTTMAITCDADNIYFSANTGGGGVTPTNDVLFWNSTESAYTPYSTKTIGTFYSGTTCPTSTGCQLNYDGTLTSTCMCSCGSRSCYFGIICDGLGSTFGATTTCAYIQDYHGTVALKSGSYGNISVCYGFSTIPVLYVDRTYSMNNNGHKGAAILVCDNPTSIGGDGIACGGIFEAKEGATTRIFMNPRMRPSGGTAYFFDTHEELTGATSTLLSIRNNASEKFAITYDGVHMCNLPAKTSETCGLYIDASGKLSTGVISGGSGGDSAGVAGSIQLSDGAGGFCCPAGSLYYNSSQGVYTDQFRATSCVYSNCYVGGSGLNMTVIANTTKTDINIYGNATTLASGADGGDVTLRGGTAGDGGACGAVYLGSSNKTTPYGCVFIFPKTTGSTGTNVLTINSNYEVVARDVNNFLGGGGSSAGVSGDTQFSDGSGGFVTSNVGVHRQISGGSLLQGISNSITGAGSCISEAHGQLNSLENANYSYAFGYNNCICCTAIGVYSSFLAGDGNYDNCSFGNNILMGASNIALNEAFTSVLLGNNNRACCDPTGGVNYGIALGDTNCLVGNTPVGIGYGNFASSYTVAMGYNNTAEGELSIAIGYGNKTCVGAIAGIAIGDGGIIFSGACSAMVHGYGAIGEVPSERVASAGGVAYGAYGGTAISNNGYTREINFFGYTSGTTSPMAQLMTKTCSGVGGAICCYFFDLTPRLHAMGFHVNVTGTDLTTNDSASFFFEGAIKMSGSGGTVSWIGTPSKTAYCDTGFNVNADIFANNVDKRLDICVTGETATCISWAATLWGTQARKFCP